ncbi:MAG: urease accessory protein UreD [Burkholderiales bacterium]
MDREPRAVRERAGLAGLLAFREPDPAWIIGKNALLCLQVLQRGGRTEIDAVRRRIPYQWLGYQYQDHDDQPFLVLHNSGGGFVENDSALLQIEAQPFTRLLVTTSAANKFYKCDTGGICRDEVEVSVGAGGLFEYLPDEAIPYAHSRIVRATRINVAASARVFASDTISAGRVNFGAGELFAFDMLRSEFELRIDGKLAVLDRQFAGTAEQVSAYEQLWGGYRHLSTIWAYAPDLPGGLEERIHDVLHEIPESTAGVTRIGNVICVRILSVDAWHAHEGVYRVWEIARPAIAGKLARPIRKP